MRLGLIPISHRRDVILQRQIPAFAAPAQGLHGDAKVVLEADGVQDMKAVHSVPVALMIGFVLLGLGGDIGVAQERGGVVVVKTPGPAEIILGAGAADGGELRIPVDERFELSLAPPAVAVLLPGQVRADIVALALHAVEDNVVFLVRQRIAAAETRMKIGRAIRDRTRRIVDGVEESAVLLRRTVLHRYPRACGRAWGSNS